MKRIIRSALFTVLLMGVLGSPLALAAKGETKIHWYGQAAFEVVTPSGGVILIDPWLTAPTNPDKNSVAGLTRGNVIPIHFGTFGLLAGSPEQFRTELAKRNIADRLTVMKPGDDRTL